MAEKSSFSMTAIKSDVKYDIYSFFYIENIIGNKLPIGSHKTVASALCYQQTGIGEELLAFSRYAEVLHLNIHCVVQLLITTLLRLTLRDREVGLQLAMTLTAGFCQHLHRSLVLLLLLQFLLFLMRELLTRRFSLDLHIRELLRDVLSCSILSGLLNRLFNRLFNGFLDNHLTVLDFISLLCLARHRCT